MIVPYIKQDERKKFDEFFNKLPWIESKGELEYLIFKLMRYYMLDKHYRYSTLHNCVYAAQHCADEFRRRFLDKREDEALRENGDI